MKRAAHEKPAAIERLERFRVLLLEHRDIWGSNPDKQTFLDRWVRSKQIEPSVIVVNTTKEST